MIKTDAEFYSTKRLIAELEAEVAELLNQPSCSRSVSGREIGNAIEQRRQQIHNATAEIAEYDIAEDRVEALKQAWEAFPDDLEDRFKPGSFGYFEVMDRAMVICENWCQYVQDHPSVVLDDELWHKAEQIGTALHDFYQKIALVDFDAEEALQKLEFARFVAWAEKAGVESALIKDIVQKFLDREPMPPFVVGVEEDQMDMLSKFFSTYVEAYEFHKREGNNNAWIQDAVGQKWYPKHPDFSKLAET